eukprot:m.640835 g.640835  ORF g.640835 m.640835 type:complete len:401 (-) comp58344_c2_seq6:227-1429(-)
MELVQGPLLGKGALPKRGLVGLYFSALWSPPCRSFTPRLVEWLANFKKNSPHRDQLEIVLVSFDRDETAFDEYRKEINFLALPYCDRAQKNQLVSRFGVRGLPTLIFLDTEGGVVTRDGRSVIEQDAEGTQFPWRPKPLTEILGYSFVNNKGDKFTRSAIEDKYIGLYFSAQWCPPCRPFTARLIELYGKLQAEKKPFEIIFISSDQDRESFQTYFSSMPWLSLDADADARKLALSKYFEVEGIPTLVLLDPSLKVVTLEGRGVVTSDPDGQEFPWIPKPITPLTDAALPFLNEAPFLLVSTDGSAAQVHAAITALAPAADAEAARPHLRLRLVYVIDPEEEVLYAIRGYAQLTPLDVLVILDVRGNKKFFAPSQDVTGDNVLQFVNAYLAGTLVGQNLR